MMVSPAERHSAIKALGQSSSFPEKNGVDIAFVSRGKFFGIQRKEIKDFVASAIDGRLYQECQQMLSLEQAMVVIEGRPQWTTTGELMGTWSRWTYPAHVGCLWSVRAKGIWVDWSDDEEGTAWLAELWQAWVRKEKHTALESRPGAINSFGKHTDRATQLHLVMGIPGFGPTLAANVIDTVGMPFGIVKTDAELLSVPGLGAGKLQQLRKAFET